jgi:uncharacterized membrane protein YgaE (UPF0421/DUF939 family)
MLQIVLIIIALIILFLYLKAKPQKPPLNEKINARVESFRSEMTRFLKEVREKATQTKIKRLEIEIGKFKKARQLDTILEKAEQEKDPKKAIDYYLEAFSFITRNNFELERKDEIKNKIKALQARTELGIPSDKS